MTKIFHTEESLLLILTGVYYWGEANLDIELFLATFIDPMYPNAHQYVLQDLRDQGSNSTPATHQMLIIEVAGIQISKDTLIGKCIK